MSKATVVSIYPFELKELKPGLNPGFFQIPACNSYDEPVLFTVGPSMYHVYLGEKRNFPVEVEAIKIAQSIVNDIVNSHLESDDESHAGLLAIDGEINGQILKTKYKDHLQELKNCQTRWFRKLVVMADNDWEKYHTHVSISDLQRKAVSMLNLERPYMDVIKSDVPKLCPVCQDLIPVNAIVCKSCKAVLDVDKYKEFQFAASVK